LGLKDNSMSERIELTEFRKLIRDLGSSKERPWKTDKLIEEFTKKVIDKLDPSEALEWIRAEARANNFLRQLVYFYVVCMALRS
jgi:hypothetical protein